MALEQNTLYMDEPSQLTAFEYASEIPRLLSHLEWLLLEGEEAAEERIKTKSRLGQSANGVRRGIDVSLNVEQKPQTGQL